MDVEKIQDLVNGLFENKKVISFETLTFKDRSYSPRGWQYKKYGNSYEGQKYNDELKKNSTFLEAKYKDSRSDYDLKVNHKNYYLSLDGKILTEVHITKSNSGKETNWEFVIIKLE